MVRQTDHCVKVGMQSASDPYIFILSDETVDRVGDVIRAKGWQLADFQKNPIALFGHDHGFPVGVWKDVKVVGKRLQGRLELAKQGTSARIDEIRSLVEQGILKAVSVGFQIKDYVPMDEKEPYGGWDITKAALLETSLVSVPANPAALAKAHALGVSKATIAEVFGKQDMNVPARHKTGVNASNPNSNRKGTAMNSIADRIVDGQKRLDALKNEVTSITDAAASEGRDLMTEETALIKEYAAQAEELEESIEGWKVTEKLMGERAAAASRSKATPTYAKAKAQSKPGDLFAKMAIATMQADKERKSVLQVVDERFGAEADPIKAAFVIAEKAETMVADTTTDGWAEQLVRNETMGFIEALTGNSMYRALSAAGTTIPFGNNASITMPYRSGNKKVAGSFRQEGGSIPVKQDHLTSITFNRFSMDVITSMTNEVVNLSQPGIVEVVRRSILDDTEESLDAHVVSTLVGVPGVRPPGILNGAPNQPATTPAGDSLNEILTDIRYLRSVLNASNARSAMYLMHPTNADALGLVTNASGAFVFPNIMGDNDNGNLMGTRVIVSTHMATDMVALVAPDSFATAYGNPNFDMSQSTSLVMIDDDGVDPSMYHSGTEVPGVDLAGSVDISGAAGVVGGPVAVKSMFQTNSTALRMMMPVSYGWLRAGQVSYITGVAW